MVCEILVINRKYYSFFSWQSTSLWLEGIMDNIMIPLANSGLAYESQKILYLPEVRVWYCLSTEREDVQSGWSQLSLIDLKHEWMNDIDILFQPQSALTPIAFESCPWHCLPLSKTYKKLICMQHDWETTSLCLKKYLKLSHYFSI